VVALGVLGVYSYVSPELKETTAQPPASPSSAAPVVPDTGSLPTLPTDPIEHRATVRALALTAQRALAARHDAHQLEAELRQLIMAVAPALLTQPGIGPITAAQLLISWSHPGRLRSEAAFAMLAGAAPVPASSGQVVRHRLNRGGTGS